MQHSQQLMLSCWRPGRAAIWGVQRANYPPVPLHTTSPDCTFLIWQGLQHSELAWYHPETNRAPMCHTTHCTWSQLCTCSTPTSTCSTHTTAPGLNFEHQYIFMLESGPTTCIGRNTGYLQGDHCRRSLQGIVLITAWAMRAHFLYYACLVAWTPDRGRRTINLRGSHEMEWSCRSQEPGIKSTHSSRMYSVQLSAPAGLQPFYA